MKNTVIKLVCFMAALSIIVTSFYACKGKNGEDAISTSGEESTVDAMASTAEGDTNTTAKTLEMYQIDEIIQDAIGYDIVWDGDYTMLTDDQKLAIQQKMYEKGFVAEFNSAGMSVKSIAEFESSRNAEDGSSTTFAPVTTTAASSTTTTKKAEDIPDTDPLSTNATVATTKKGETTTARRGIVAGTTAPNLAMNQTTTKKATSTTAASGNTTAASGSSAATTVTSASSGSGGASGSGSSVTPGTIQKPNTTYYDKYVTNVLKSGRYTLAGVMEEDGNKIAFTRYMSGDKSSVVAKVTSSSITVTMKIISSNDKVTILIPALQKYYVTKASEFSDFADMDSIEDITGIMNDDSLSYAGLTSSNGTNIESYKSADGAMIKFFFDSSGLKKVSVKDASGNTTEYNITIVAGVTSGEAFTVPSSYKEISEADLEKYLGGLGA